MKKVLITLLVLAVLAAGLWFFREPILDLLPIDQSGWVERSGNRYYLNEKGDPLTGWQQLEDRTCYFSAEGILQIGWLELDGERYCFDESGTMRTGWQTIAGQLHRFDDQGKLLQGFLEEDGKRFYLDENGTPDSGFFSDGETTYFLLNSGAIYSGWLQFSDGTYYINEDGALLTGWLDTPEGKFHIDNDGTITYRLVKVDGVFRGYGPNGAPLTGWVELDGQRYRFNDDGTACHGWLEEDGKRYYIREDGTPAVGKLVIDERAYFFSSTGMNFLFVNPWHALPDDFSVDLVQACGTWLDPLCQEALEKMLADCRAAGHSPQMVSGYRSITDQRYSLDRMIKSYTNKGYSYDQAYAVSTQIVAVPGTSEHHLGLAFDIVDSAYPKLNHQQATMPTQKWLMEHCWEYGFILRYPEDSTDITGIIWEPWHYRYVGVELALEIRDLGGIPLEIYIDNLTNDGTTCGGTPEVTE